MTFEESPIAQLPCAQGLIAMAAEGARLGWHEANGGNATYRLAPDEAEAVRALCARNDLEPGTWQPLAEAVPGLAGRCFLVTAAGSFMGKLGQSSEERLGVVELDEAGSRFRVMAGLRNGARPTSEFLGHLLIHQTLEAVRANDRVLYHAHPDALIALSMLLPLEPRAITRALWKADTECILAVPEGVGVVPCLVPGSLELARASAVQMQDFRAVLWASHGLLCSATDFDDALGRMHSLAKAANIHLLARAASGDAADIPQQVPDQVLAAISDALSLSANPAFLRSQGE